MSKTIVTAVPLLLLGAGCQICSWTETGIRTSSGQPSLHLLASVPEETDSGDSSADEMSACPGMGAPSVSFRFTSPAAGELKPGVGVGCGGLGAMLLLMQTDYAIWGVGDGTSGDWAGMAEVAFGFGPVLPVSVLGGIGAAIPLWDTGSLDVRPTFLCYAELLTDITWGEWGRNGLSLAARYTWYLDEAELESQPVKLDGWGLIVSFFF